MKNLPIIQKSYDLVKWYIPILNRLPRDHKFMLGNRIIGNLYDLLEGLILAQYRKDKLDQLRALNGRLDLIRHQTRLLLEFELMDARRYKYVSELINGIGNHLGGWIKQQQRRSTERPSPKKRL